ncbi:hypothetical protein D920_00304 [Enterococcus faecalis 13-SD-W-01]|nr:hypothetical protein D920_00304 [Enterococcus faecalis 13-SD-W-01]
MKTNFERGQLNAQDDLNTNFTEIQEFMDTSVPLEAFFTNGADGSNVTVGYKYPIGSLVATDSKHTASDLPFTFSEDRTTITMTRDATLFISGMVKFHGSGTGAADYAYCKLRYGTTLIDFANIGAPSGQTLNLFTGQSGKTVVSVKNGETINFELEVRSGKQLFRSSITSLYIKEVQGM